jgi:NADH pyrophosphatase NudC (nudix superfamily)
VRNAGSDGAVPCGVALSWSGVQRNDHMHNINYCPKCASRLDIKAVAGIERKVCSSPGCDFVHWDNPLPVVAALVEHQGQIVLARNAKWPRGIFSFVSGFLERKETPQHAVLREVREELGLDGEVRGFIGHYPFGEMNQIIMAFWVRGAGEVRTSDEIAEIKRVSVEQLRAYDFGPLYITSAVVRDWFAQGTAGQPR